MMKVKNKTKHTTEQALKKLKEQGFFGVPEAAEAGISKATLSRLAAKGEIIRAGHGLYIHPESNLSAEVQDYVRACSKFGPDSVIGGITALFHYHLVEQVPQVIWVIVPQDKQTRDKLYRLIRVKSVKKKIGIVKHNHFVITNIERTLVEAFVYANKTGMRTAMEAITRAIKEKKTNLTKVMKMARELGYDNIMGKHWESIIGALQG